MSIDPAAPSPTSPEQRSGANLVELARRVAILERATKGSTAWKPITSFLNGWASGPGTAGTRIASYWIDDNGVVHLGGFIVSPTPAPVGTGSMFQMPAEAKPAAAVYWAAYNVSGPGTAMFGLLLDVNGLVSDSTIPAAGSLIALDGLTYRIV